MTAKSNVRTDNEDNKFVNDTNGDVAVNTVSDSLGASIIHGINFDAIGVSFPNNTTEIYSYYEGGLAGTLLATVTVVYTNAAKDFVSSVVKS